MANANRTEYMRQYMAKRRAEKEPSRKLKMERALNDIVSKLGGRTTPIANELRAIAENALKA